MNSTNNEKITDSERLIHTPSSFARKNLTYAQETGSLKSLKEHSSVRENMDSYLFFIITGGQGKVITGGHEYAVKKGDAVLLDCRKRYEHRSSGENPWEISWIHFNGAMPAKLFPLFNEANGESPVFTMDDADAYMKLLDDLKACMQQKNVVSEINQGMIIDELIVKCLNQVSKDKSLSVDNSELDGDEFSTLRESVNEHIDEDGLERILAIQYGLQPEDLSKLFQDKYGISLPDYILNRKLNKSKELLRFTIKSLDEIVEEAGFADEGLFRSMFMESEKMTPEDYRKRWAQWIKS